MTRAHLYLALSNAHTHPHILLWTPQKAAQRDAGVDCILHRVKESLGAPVDTVCWSPRTASTMLGSQRAGCIIQVCPLWRRAHAAMPQIAGAFQWWRRGLGAVSWMSDRTGGPSSAVMLPRATSLLLSGPPHHPSAFLPFHAILCRLCA